MLNIARELMGQLRKFFREKKITRSTQWEGEFAEREKEERERSSSSGSVVWLGRMERRDREREREEEDRQDNYVNYRSIFNRRSGYNYNDLFEPCLSRLTKRVRLREEAGGGTALSRELFLVTQGIPSDFDSPISARFYGIIVLL